MIMVNEAISRPLLFAVARHDPIEDYRTEHNGEAGEHTLANLSLLQGFDHNFAYLVYVSLCSAGGAHLDTDLIYASTTNMPRPPTAHRSTWKPRLK
jgi:hypothetical protein